METFKKSIQSNMNSNGGGLAVTITGRYESNRHAIARNEKFTFGEVCKELSKKKNGNFKISASKLLEIYRIVVGEPEWHHAGFLPKQYGGGMKKTYFLDVIPTIEDVKAWIENAKEKNDELIEFAKIEEKKKEIKYKFLNKYGQKFNREREIPKFSFIEEEEMNGKFGWFEAQSYRYNLPIYYSGWFFKSKKTLDKYLLL